MQITVCVRGGQREDSEHVPPGNPVFSGELWKKSHRPFGVQLSEATTSPDIRAQMLFQCFWLAETITGHRRCLSEDKCSCQAHLT